MGFLGGGFGFGSVLLAIFVEQSHFWQFRFRVSVFELIRAHILPKLTFVLIDNGVIKSPTPPHFLGPKLPTKNLTKLRGRRSCRDALLLFLTKCTSEAVTDAEGTANDVTEGDRKEILRS